VKRKSEEAKSLKLTKTEVEKLQFDPSKGNNQQFVWDSELKGFGVRLTPLSKTYIVQSRVDGKTCRYTIGKHGAFTAEEARKEAYKKFGEMASGSHLNEARRERKAKTATLQEVWNQYRDIRDLRPTTIKVYENALKNCFGDWLEKSVTSISKDMVEKRHRYLSEFQGPRSGKDGAKALANQAMRVLRSILNFAANKFEDSEGRSILPENPVKRLSQSKSWNKSVRRQGVIHKSQLKAWWEAVESLDKSVMRDYLHLCLLTGLRRNEAAQLTWANINFDDSYLKIEADKSKNHQEHRLPLSDKLSQILKDRFDASDKINPYVFPGRSGVNTHLVESKFSVAKVVQKSGVQFMVHDLRRTFLTIAEGLDVPHYALKRLANHKDNSDVTSGYIVNDVERLREPMQQITNFIMAQVNETKQPVNFPSKKKTQTTDTHRKIEAV